jgi:hypothetical protein
MLMSVSSLVWRALAARPVAGRSPAPTMDKAARKIKYSFEIETFVPRDDAAEDFKEGVTAFLEKRPAKLKGR